MQFASKRSRNQNCAPKSGFCPLLGLLLLLDVHNMIHDFASHTNLQHTQWSPYHKSVTDSEFWGVRDALQIVTVFGLDHQIYTWPLSLPAALIALWACPKSKSTPLKLLSDYTFCVGQLM